MQRYLGWLISAVVALVVYGGLTVLDVPKIIVLIMTFVGAMIGALVGADFIRRLGAQDSATDPNPPGPGSGRKAK